MNEDGRVRRSYDLYRRAGNARMSEPVILSAFLRITEHGIRFGRFLEALFSLMVSWIAVRMVLQREFAISALDFLIGSLT